MYATIKFLHGYWAILALVILMVAVINAVIKISGKGEYSAKDFRIALFTLIVFHIQLLLGIILFFSAGYITQIGEIGMGEIMKIPLLRSNIVEHPLIMIIAVMLITVGYSIHKKKLTSAAKFKRLVLFYGLALLFVAVKIPWKTWSLFN